MSALRVVSLFCGGGFAEEALRLASAQTGIATEVVMAVDSWEPAARMRDANFGGVRTTVRSVKDMTRDDLPPHDLVIGGPPCQDHSLAGKRACRCHVGGPVAERCCLADFVRLRGDVWLMENVRPRLLTDGWSEQFCAADFGDVTSRKRWFYSSHVLQVWPTPGPRRFGDIRDHEADRVAIGRRAMANVSSYADGDILGSMTAHAWHGHETRTPTKLVGLGIVPDDGVLGSLTRSHYHGSKNNGGGGRTANTRSYPQAFTEIGDMLGSLTSGKGGSTGFLKVGLRGHSASASAFEDDEIIGSLVSNSWHGNELNKLGPSVRCPSLLEMARAHSIPDTWEWAGVTKTQRGQIIANGWPLGMGTALCAAMLRAMAANA